MGQVNGEPALLGTLRAAIISYRANPIVTGLLERHVENWMTPQYIANSTGIPVETLLQSANLPLDGNAHKPLGFLADETNYPGGSQALEAALQKIVDTWKPLASLTFLPLH